MGARLARDGGLKADRFLPDIPGSKCGSWLASDGGLAGGEIFAGVHIHYLRYRPSTATQLLESFAFGEGVHSELARVLVTSLRDGCDLLDVVGRRLQGRV